MLMNRTPIRRKAGKFLIGLLSLVLLAGCSLAPTLTSVPTEPVVPQPGKTSESTPGMQVTLHVMPTHAQVTQSPPDATETPTPAGKIDVTLPQPNSADWTEWVGGLNLPVDIAFLPNAPGVAYILQQEGKIVVVDNGNLLAQSLLDLTGTAVRQGNEQGLLGIALDPQFSSNRYFYLNYTDRNGNTVIARYQAAENFLTVDPATAKILLQVEQPYPNHNGGALAVGPDGYLYIALGDGGSANDPQGNGQNLDTLLGKILRIDVSGDPYVIPADNPYVNGGGRPEIWASGLRNPWRISFDQLRGDL
jgi:glucose/arabinose dehydrogenase